MIFTLVTRLTTNNVNIRARFIRVHASTLNSGLRSGRALGPYSYTCASANPAHLYSRFLVPVTCDIILRIPDEGPDHSLYIYKYVQHDIHLSHEMLW